ncbi:MAG: DUF302 domain-containing protein [Desulfosarcinaceae bacterium]|nr:DUF302 domain-containing protein [Desulfosarcinaceae bacterium]
MKSWQLLLCLLILPINAAGAAEELLRKPSPHTVGQTIARFEAAVRARGLMVFPRYDHAAAALAYGQAMPPVVVVAFGNPKYGTPFMRQVPEAGIDFPPKAIVYQDESGQVWIAYNSADYLYDTIFARHGLDYPPNDKRVYAELLEALTDAAVAVEIAP